MRLLSMIFDYILKFFGLRKVTDLKGKSGDSIRKKWRSIRINTAILTLLIIVIVPFLPFFITSSLPAGLSFSDKVELASLEKNNIIGAYNTFVDNYGCIVPVTIESFIAETVGYTEDGKEIAAFEEAESGVIRIARGTNFYTTTMHAMTHACVSNEIPLQNVFVSDYSRVDGYIGASFTVTTINGESTRFTQLEEAIAEYLKKNITGSVDSGLGANYYNTICIFEYLWPKDKVTAKELSRLVQNSELPTILGYIYDRNISTINSNVADITFKIFDTSRKSIEPCDELKAKADLYIKELE